MSSYNPGYPPIPPSIPTRPVPAPTLAHKLSRTTGPGGAAWRVAGYSTDHQQSQDRVGHDEGVDGVDVPEEHDEMDMHLMNHEDVECSGDIQPATPTLQAAHSGLLHPLGTLDPLDSTSPLQQTQPMPNGPHMQAIQAPEVHETNTRDTQHTHTQHSRHDSAHDTAPLPYQHHHSSSPGAPDKSRTLLTPAPTPPSPIRPKSARLQPAPACLPFSLLQVLSVVTIVTVFVSCRLFFSSFFSVCVFCRLIGFLNR